MSKTANKKRLPGTLAPLCAAALALAFAPSALAGPTVSADLDLGTSVGRDYVSPSAPAAGPGPGVGPADPSWFSKLYIVGFRVRGGWRFDLGPVFLLPELGVGYDVQRYTTGNGSPTSLPRVFGGVRGGVSLPLAPLVLIEPGVYGHVGFAYQDGYTGGPGIANDVGLALDLRLLRRLLIGAHVGYEVVTNWTSAATSVAPFQTGPSQTVVLADRWVGYGVHAGVLFW